MGKTLLQHTQSLCPVCLRRIDAAYVREGAEVFFCKTCPQHGAFRVLAWRQAAGLADFSAWQQGRVPAYPAHPATALRQGCPYDCGLCPEHGQHTCTGLIEVTQRCTLHCPVCYAAAGQGAAPADPSLAIIERQLQALFTASGACNVQLSGGEPTLRDDLPHIIALAKQQGLGLVQVNSNGLRLGTEQGYAARLKEAGLDSVYLQWDGTDDTIFQTMRGRPCLAWKQAALQACREARLGVVLVATVARGVNDHALGDLLRFAVAQGAVVRGLHLQPVASFGRFPWELANAPRLSLPDLMLALEEQSAGMVRAADFHAPSCEHSLCSFSAVYGRDGQGGLQGVVGAACCGTGGGQGAVLDNASGSRRSKAFIAAHWGSPAEKGAQGSASVQGAQAAMPLMDDLSRFVAQAGADRRFTLSAMAFQDALSFDIARVRGCCIHVVTEQGKLIPFCAYNLTSFEGIALYRGKEKR
ncbi:MAG: radical SAM protein [Desulfovibrionaceae bacterium]|nr:radical SAM protein [Desulfovibrionaceae bacterium]